MYRLFSLAPSTPTPKHSRLLSSWTCFVRLSQGTPFFFLLFFTFLFYYFLLFFICFFFFRLSSLGLVSFFFFLFLEHTEINHDSIVKVYPELTSKSFGAIRFHPIKRIDWQTGKVFYLFDIPLVSCFLSSSFFFLFFFFSLNDHWPKFYEWRNS